MRYGIAGAFVATFACAAAIIYVAIGSRHSLASRPAGMSMVAPAAAPAAGASAKSAASAKSMEAEVAALEARLSRDGGTADDWALLAKAYDFLGRPDDARRARAQTPRTGAGVVTQMNAGALVAAATATETRAASAEPAPAAATASVAELEQRVKANPRDVQSWLALAELRHAQHDNPAARDALAKVVALKGMTAQSWADYADVLASLSEGSLTGAAGSAIDSALALDPRNTKALWLKASQAHEQRHFADALSWWKRLRSALPADSPDARIIDGNIAEDTSLAGLAPASASAAGASAAGASAAGASAAGASAAGASVAGAAAPVAAASAAEVSGTVSIDSRLADRVQRDATLFIYAKAADSPGPPLAVLRTTAAAWPVSFHLDDSMAMIPSRRLSQFDKVVVEARISRSGQATPSSGDLYVTSPVMHPAAGKKLALVINREIG